MVEMEVLWVYVYQDIVLVDSEYIDLQCFWLLLYVFCYYVGGGLVFGCIFKVEVQCCCVQLVVVVSLKNVLVVVVVCVVSNLNDLLWLCVIFLVMCLRYIGLLWWWVGSGCMVCGSRQGVLVLIINWFVGIVFISLCRWVLWCLLQIQLVMLMWQFSVRQLCSVLVVLVKQCMIVVGILLWQWCSRVMKLLCVLC